MFWSLVTYSNGLCHTLMILKVESMHLTFAPTCECGQTVLDTGYQGGKGVFAPS